LWAVPLICFIHFFFTMDDTEVILQGIAKSIDTEQVAKQLEQAFKDVLIYLNNYFYLKKKLDSVL